MKHFHIFLLIVLLTFTCFPPHIAQAQDASTWMPDSNLRTAVRTSLGLADGEALTQAGMLNLTDLRAARRGISNLTGLAYATNLSVATVSTQSNLGLDTPIGVDLADETSAAR